MISASMASIFLLSSSSTSSLARLARSFFARWAEMVFGHLAARSSLNFFSASFSFFSSFAIWGAFTV